MLDNLRILKYLIFIIILGEREVMFVRGVGFIVLFLFYVIEN